MVGHVCLLLKPNLSEPYNTATTDTGAADAANGATGLLGGNTITIGASQDISGLAVGNNATTCNWIVVGTQRWRVLSIALQVMTIEGTIGTAFTNAAWETHASVPAFIRWTDPSTITYLKLEFGSSSEDLTPVIDIKRFANNGSVIIALGKIESQMRAFKNMFAGCHTNSETSVETQSSQISKALNYMKTQWPKTSPKYSNLYWYNGYKRVDHRDEWSTGSTFRMERGVIRKISKDEDFVNNLTIGTLGLELV